ncbi:MAG: aromatic amino acid lyase, partial [Gemmatimonadetes bacterium]|nr:aromatic amino acid lyase [Gemmatimonadota bacterium]
METREGGEAGHSRAGRRGIDGTDCRRRRVKPLVLNGKTLTAREVDDVARGYRSVRLDKSVKAEVDAGVACVRDAIAAKKIVYGIDTGFGELASVSISESDLAVLQRNL